VEAGATLNTNGFTITVNGTVDAGTSITGTGTVAVAGTGVTMAGVFPNVTVSGTATALAGTQITGDLTVSGLGANLTLSGALTVPGLMTVQGSGVGGIATVVLGGLTTVGTDLVVTGVSANAFGDVVLNGQRLEVAGNVATTGTGGRLRMEQAADVLVIGGDATFTSLIGPMNAGVIELAGNMSGTVGATGTHRVVFTGSGAPQTVNLGAGALQDVEVQNPAGLQLSSPVTVGGTLTTLASSPIAGSVSVTVAGDATIGGDVTLNGLTVGGALSVGGAYSVPITTFTGAGQTLPALPYQDLTVFGTGAMYAGGAVSGALTVSGDLAVSGALALGGDLTVSGLGANLTLSGALTVPGLMTVEGSGVGGIATVILGGLTTVDTDLVVTGVSANAFGDIVLNGQRLEVAGNVTTTGTGGRIRMEQAADVLVIGGDATFTSLIGPMSAGVMELAGNMSGTVSATGTHRVVFTGSGAPQTVNLGAGALQDVEVQNPAGLQLSSAMQANGTLIVSAAVTPTIGGGNNLITVGGWDIDGLVFDNAPLVSAARSSRSTM
jgi:hypothetical protein